MRRDWPWPYALPIVILMLALTVTSSGDKGQSSRHKALSRSAVGVRPTGSGGRAAVGGLAGPRSSQAVAPQPRAAAAPTPAAAAPAPLSTPGEAAGTPAPSGSAAQVPTAATGPTPTSPTGATAATASPTAPPSGQAVRLCLGAFPREGVKRDAGSEVLARSYDGLQRLVTETGLNIRGMIVYLGVTPGNVDELRSGRRPHYLADADIKTLTDLVARGIVPRFSLEPHVRGGDAAMKFLSESRDVLTDIAQTLAPLGPCTMRVASELNLWDSIYHIPTTSAASMSLMAKAFATVHEVFSQHAPNVAVSFSPFIPNGPTEYERDHCLHLIARYVPVVKEHVDLFTGTFYPRSPEEVPGLIAYAKLVARTGKPFGIDELGCRDEATFSAVMQALVGGQIGTPTFLNFYDRHVKKPGIDNPWHLKPADKKLLRELREQGVLVDA